MLRVCSPICVIVLMLAACGDLATPRTSTMPEQQAAVASEAPAEITSANTCPVTTAVTDQPPKDPNADAFGSGPWYINADGTIWVGVPQDGWRAGGEKVMWIRPAGSDLVVTGRRLDGEAPPLRADIPCCYPTGFQASGLTFPTGGCWEVMARAGDKELRVVTKVRPGEEHATRSPCASLPDAVEQSFAVVVGWVTDTDIEGRYAWHEVSIREAWKLPPGWSSIGDRISLLQDMQAEPKLDKNGRYVLFLKQDPWRLVCPQQSVVEQRGEQALPLGKNALWQGGGMADLQAKVQELAATR